MKILLIIISGILLTANGLQSNSRMVNISVEYDPVSIQSLGYLIKEFFPIMNSKNGFTCSHLGLQPKVEDSENFNGNCWGDIKCDIRNVHKIAIDTLQNENLGQLIDFITYFVELSMQYQTVNLKDAIETASRASGLSETNTQKIISSINSNYYNYNRQDRTSTQNPIIPNINEVFSTDNYNLPHINIAHDNVEDCYSLPQSYYKFAHSVRDGFAISEIDPKGSTVLKECNNRYSVKRLRDILGDVLSPYKKTCLRKNQKRPEIKSLKKPYKSLKDTQQIFGQNIGSTSNTQYSIDNDVKLEVIIQYSGTQFASHALITKDIYPTFIKEENGERINNDVKFTLKPVGDIKDIPFVDCSEDTVCQLNRAHSRIIEMFQKENEQKGFAFIASLMSNVLQRIKYPTLQSCIKSSAEETNINKTALRDVFEYMNNYYCNPNNLESIHLPDTVLNPPLLPKVYLRSDRYHIQKCFKPNRLQFSSLYLDGFGDTYVYNFDPNYHHWVDCYGHAIRETQFSEILENTMQEIQNPIKDDHQFSNQRDSAFVLSVINASIYGDITVGDEKDPDQWDAPQLQDILRNALGNV